MLTINNRWEHREGPQPVECQKGSFSSFDTVHKLSYVVLTCHDMLYSYSLFEFDPLLQSVKYFVKLKSKGR